MTLTAKQSRYSPATLARAKRAVRSMPFHLALFQTMRWQSVDLRAIAGANGVQNGYVKRLLSETAAERDLLWLIQVGMLRREVDGQGLTNSFRLTPLGHQIVEQLAEPLRENGLGETSLGEQNSLPPVSNLERLSYLLSRWLRLPNWLQF